MIDKRSGRGGWVHVRLAMDLGVKRLGMRPPAGADHCRAVSARIVRELC